MTHTERDMNLECQSCGRSTSELYTHRPGALAQCRACHWEQYGAQLERRSKVSGLGVILLAFVALTLTAMTTACDATAPIDPAYKCLCIGDSDAAGKHRTQASDCDGVNGVNMRPFIGSYDELATHIPGRSCPGLTK